MSLQYPLCENIKSVRKYVDDRGKDGDKPVVSTLVPFSRERFDLVDRIHQLPPSCGSLDQSFWEDAVTFDKLMYKNKNQHRSSKYFRYLQHVQRSYRQHLRNLFELKKGHLWKLLRQFYKCCSVSIVSQKSGSVISPSSSPSATADYSVS